MSETLTTEQVEEILRGCEGVTPGPWKMEGSIYEHMGAGIRSIPDDRGFAQFWSSGTVALDTAHIARLDPQTVSSLATELLALRKRVEWQDISTAPKDGTYILASPVLLGTAGVVVWDPPVKTPPLMLAKGESIAHSGYWRLPLSPSASPYQPTHWMPLPTSEPTS